MSHISKLERYVDQLVERPLDPEEDLLQQVKNRRRGAKDATLAFLALDDLSATRRWASAAAPDYLDYARFVSDERLDPERPPEQLTSSPWSDALLTIQLATFAGDEDTRAEAATDVLEWTNLSFLDDCQGRDQNITIDLAAGIAAVILGHDPEPHFETLRDHYDAMEEPNIYATRDRNIASAVEGIVDNSSDRVTDACRELDEYHEQLDSYDSSATEAVNMQACFCVAFARERGLDVTYTSEYVPESLISHYPLE